MRTAPGVLRCLGTILLCDLALRVLGFGRALRLARAVGAAPPRADVERLISDTLKNIVIATALYPGRSKCLEQALAAFVLLRRRGAPVQIRLGVQPYPFLAHAWLEMNGRPVTETAEVVSRFALLPDPAL